MAEEIGFENGRNSNFQGLVDLGSGHTAYRLASLIDLSTYIPNFNEIEETFCGPTDGRT